MVRIALTLAEMQVAVQLAGGVRLRDVLHMEERSTFISLYSLDSLTDLRVACAAVALRDGGAQSGMSLVQLQVVAEDGSTTVIDPDEDGVKGNWKKRRLLIFEEEEWRKSNTWAPWPAITSVFAVSIQSPGRKAKFSRTKDRAVTLM